MATAITTPQPLTSEEIKEGITVRMCAELPEYVAGKLNPAIYASLGKTCSLNSSMYSKFSAKWTLRYWETEKGYRGNWWIEYALDDFGRVTRGGIGFTMEEPPENAVILEGKIDEMPPDTFRRETKQPIPSPAIIKKPEREQSTMSKSMRGPGKRRDV